MKNDHKNIDIIDPKNQLNLFGYKNYFDSFIKLYKKNKKKYFIVDNSNNSHEAGEIILRRFIKRLNK